MDATISVVCYKSKTLSNGEHPLMLRISKDGKKKYQSLGISVNPKFWDFQKNKPKPKCPNLEYLQKIILDKKLELQKKKLEIKSDQKEYSAATLLEANANLLVAKTVDCFYKEIIAQCEINNKCGNRLVYLNSYNSLKRFTNGKLEIPFNSIAQNSLDYLFPQCFSVAEIQNPFSSLHLKSGAACYISLQQVYDGSRLACTGSCIDYIAANSPA